jgi:hypothetical protein
VPLTTLATSGHRASSVQVRRRRRARGENVATAATPSPEPRNKIGNPVQQDRLRYNTQLNAAIGEDECASAAVIVHHVLGSRVVLDRIDGQVPAVSRSLEATPRRLAGENEVAIHPHRAKI